MTRRIVVAAVAVGATLAACVLPATARADAPDDAIHAEPCRPTVTCTADLVAPGIFELESGGNLAHASGQAAWSLPVLLKQGLLRWLELEVGTNGLTVFRDTGGYTYLDDIVVGPKVRFFEQHGLLPSLAASAEVSAPTFSAEGYQRNWDLFLALYASKKIGPVNVDVNGGFNQWRLGESGGRPQGLVSGAVTKSLPANFAVEAAVFYQTGVDPDAPRDGGAQGAVTYSPVSWLVLDAGADWGFFPSERQYSIFAGLTVIPVVFWRPGNTE